MSCRPGVHRGVETIPPPHVGVHRGRETVLPPYVRVHRGGDTVLWPCVGMLVCAGLRKPSLRAGPVCAAVAVVFTGVEKSSLCLVPACTQVGKPTLHYVQVHTWVDKLSRHPTQV